MAQGLGREEGEQYVPFLSYRDRTRDRSVGRADPSPRTGSRREGNHQSSLMGPANN